MGVSGLRNINKLLKNTEAGWKYKDAETKEDKGGTETNHHIKQTSKQKTKLRKTPATRQAGEMSLSRTQLQDNSFNHSAPV